MYRPQISFDFLCYILLLGESTTESFKIPSKEVARRGRAQGTMRDCV